MHCALLKARNEHVVGSRACEAKIRIATLLPADVNIAPENTGTSVRVLPFPMNLGFQRSLRHVIRLRVYLG